MALQMETSDGAAAATTEGIQVKPAYTMKSALFCAVSFPVSCQWVSDFFHPLIRLRFRVRPRSSSSSRSLPLSPSLPPPASLSCSREVLRLPGLPVLAMCEILRQLSPLSILRFQCHLQGHGSRDDGAHRCHSKTPRRRKQWG